LDVLIWKFIRGFAYMEGDMAKENLPCPVMWHQKYWWARSGMSKRMSYGKIYRPDVIRTSVHIRVNPRGRFFTCRRVFTVRADGKKKKPRGCISAEAAQTG
jgi:hypothetical protein